MQQISQTAAPLTRKGRGQMAHPADIKAAIEKAGSSQADIAREFKVSRPTVNKVVYGQASSLRIAAHIAKLIGKSLEELWPGRYDSATNNADRADTQQPPPRKPATERKPNRSRPARRAGAPTNP